MSLLSLPTPGRAATDRPVRVGPVRRWIRRRQNDDADSVLGTVYFGVLLTAVTGAMSWPLLRALFWPEAPTGTLRTALAVPLICAGALHVALRRLGPVAVSRPAASWLLTAPMSRLALLLPSAASVSAASAAAGALAAFATVSQVADRPVPVPAFAAVVAGGALLGVAVFLGAVHAQAHRGWARATDLAAYAAVVLGGLGLVADRAGRDPGRAGLDLGAAAPPALAAAVAAAVVAYAALSVRRLNRMPDPAVFAASQAAGALFDAAYSVQPSFVTDLREKRAWQGRRWRSRPFPARVPELTAQDLRALSRKGGRLGWLAAATLVPAVLADGSGWLVAGAVLLGAMSAATTTTGSVRTDNDNPVLLRLLAVSARAALLARLWVPAALAAAWATTALVVLTAVGHLPAGPWWALGVAVAPVAAAAAVRRSRLGMVQNGLLPLDTPMGSLETGPLLGAVVGYDLLVLLGLPTAFALYAGVAPAWSTVLLQLVVGVGGLAMYVGASTSTYLSDLKARDY